MNKLCQRDICIYEWKTLKKHNKVQFNTCQKAYEYNSDEIWNVFSVKRVQWQADKLHETVNNMTRKHDVK